MRKRNPAVVAILSIVTCGIYFLYWFITTTNEIEREVADKNRACKSGGMCFFLSIITCGIYMLYWWYQQGKRLYSIQEDNGMRGDDYSVLYLILAVVTASLVPTIIMQVQKNRIVDELDYIDRKRRDEDYNKQNGEANNPSDNDYKY